MTSYWAVLGMSKVMALSGELVSDEASQTRFASAPGVPILQREGAMLGYGEKF
jgi:hypothetical protein